MPTLTYKPISMFGYKKLFKVMYDEVGDLLEKSLKQLGFSNRKFFKLFSTKGEVFTIHHEETECGFYWIEKRENILHIHALIIRKAFQRQGIGSQVLKDIENHLTEGVTTLELGVHESNHPARHLYEKQGFIETKYYDEYGYYVMQKTL